MDKYRNLRRARHHIVFLSALVFGSIFIYFLNNLDMRKQGLGVIVLEDTIAPDMNFTASDLSDKEIQSAKTAWSYFVHNYNEKTGLVNSVDKFPSTTLWDTGNYMMALISAHQLKIISDEVYHTRLSTLLHTLKSMPLYNALLPNKVYNTQTVTMTNYGNQPSKEGIGWSAIDIGRLLIPLTYIESNQPQYNSAIKAILARWHIAKMTQEGALYGAVVKDGNVSILQEGRLGYEQYSAKMFATFGIDISNALRYDKYLEFVDIDGINVAYDKRDKAHSNANNYVLMEPYMLDGLEFGWDYFSREFSYRLYKVQEQRYEKTNILTAITEDHIDQAPYFIYNSIYVNKQKWVAIDELGNVHNKFKQQSTKASFAMDALYHTPYTKKLVEGVSKLNSERGWYTGIYESDGSINKSITCNTNAIILESLLFKKMGPIVKLIKE